MYPIMKRRFLKVIQAMIYLVSILIVYASVKGYISVHVQLNEYITANQFSAKQIEELYKNVIKWGYTVFFVSLLIACIANVITRKLHSLKAWIKGTITSFLIIVVMVGYYVYYLEQSGIYKNLLFFQIPLLGLFLIVLKYLIRTIPDEAVVTACNREREKILNIIK